MTAYIVDDEQNSIDALHIMLKMYCKDIQVVGYSDDFNLAIENINKIEPQLIFLDINLHAHSGFDLLPHLTIKPGIIFTTAYENYALQALRNDAIDYLLKPIDHHELINAVSKAKHRLEVVKEGQTSTTYIDQISLSTPEGIMFLKTNDIIRLEANGGYTTFFLMNGTKFLISKNMGSFDKILEHTTCKRIHKSHIVNLRHVTKLHKASKQIDMVNGDTLPIPRERMEEFYELMASFQSKQI